MHTLFVSPIHMCKYMFICKVHYIKYLAAVCFIIIIIISKWLEGYYLYHLLYFLTAKIRLKIFEKKNSFIIYWKKKFPPFFYTFISFDVNILLTSGGFSALKKTINRNNVFVPQGLIYLFIFKNAYVLQNNSYFCCIHI